RWNAVRQRFSCSVSSQVVRHCSLVSASVAKIWLLNPIATESSLLLHRLFAILESRFINLATRDKGVSTECRNQQKQAIPRQSHDRISFFFAKTSRCSFWR